MIDVRPATLNALVVAIVLCPHRRGATPSPGIQQTKACLESDGDTFRLHDTSGVDVPKSRSWKSGFLKKRSASVTIRDAFNGLTLSNYVGQRVEVTGLLSSREMQVRSLQRVAAACS